MKGNNQRDITIIEDRKEAIINANNEMREGHPDNMEVSQECDRIEAMVQAACDRVWESQRILLTARPGPPRKA